MPPQHAINVLVTQHPQWKDIPRKKFTTAERNGWTYITYKGVEIERVMVDGKYIFEEWLGHSPNPEDYR